MFYLLVVLVVLEVPRLGLTLLVAAAGVRPIGAAARPAPPRRGHRPTDAHA